MVKIDLDRGVWGSVLYSAMSVFELLGCLHKEVFQSSTLTMHHLHVSILSVDMLYYLVLWYL